MTSLTTAPLLLIVFTITASADDDQVCLTHLYQSLQDPLNHLTNWTPPTFASPCTGFTSHLYGATCNNGRVYKLSLSSLSLRGTIPPNLSLCTSLQSLDLSSNRLSGPIPPTSTPSSTSPSSTSSPAPSHLTSSSALTSSSSTSTPRHHPPSLGSSLVSPSSTCRSTSSRAGEIPSFLGNRSGMAVRFNASSFAVNKGLYGYPLGEGRGGEG